MYQFTNTPNLNNAMNINNYEIQEAKKRMGTVNTQMGMTGSVQGVNMTSFQNVPTLNSSTAVGSAEIQKARQKMNQISPQNTQMY